METNDVVELAEEPARRTRTAARRLIVATAGISVFFAGSIAVVANTDDADEVEVSTPPHTQNPSTAGPSTTTAVVPSRFPDIALEGWDLLGSEEGDLDNLSRSEIAHNAAFRDPARGWAGPVVEVFVEAAYGDDYGSSYPYEEGAVDIGGEPGYVYEGFAGGMSIDFDKGEHHLYVDTYHLDRATSIAAAAAIVVDTDGNVTAGALPEGLAQYEIARSAPAHVFGRASEYAKDGNNVVFTMRAETAAEFERFSASCSFGSEGFDGTTALGQNALRVWNTYDEMAAVLWYADGVSYELFANAGGLDAVNDAVASLRIYTDSEAPPEVTTSTTEPGTEGTTTDTSAESSSAATAFPQLLLDGSELELWSDTYSEARGDERVSHFRVQGTTVEIDAFAESREDFDNHYSDITHPTPIEILGQDGLLMLDQSTVVWNRDGFTFWLIADNDDVLNEVLPRVYIASDEAWAAAQPAEL